MPPKENEVLENALHDFKDSLEKKKALENIIKKIADAASENVRGEVTNLITTATTTINQLMAYNETLNALLRNQKRLWDKYIEIQKELDKIRSIKFFAILIGIVGSAITIINGVMFLYKSFAR